MSDFEDVYAELHAIASVQFLNQPVSHTLQPTALVNEAFLKLSKSKKLTTKNRDHLLAVTCTAMRQILVDHARKNNAIKRGGNAGARVTLSGIESDRTPWDVLELNESLEKLKSLEPRQAQIIELRFFGGLSVEHAARVLGISENTLFLDWKMAKAWLWADLRKG